MVMAAGRARNVLESRAEEGSAIASPYRFLALPCRTALRKLALPASIFYVGESQVAMFPNDGLRRAKSVTRDVCFCAKGVGLI